MGEQTHRKTQSGDVITTFFSWRNGEKEMQSNLSFDRVLQK